MLASLLLVLPGLVAPIFTEMFVDRCLVAGRSDWVLPLLAGMAFTAALRAGLTWLQKRSLLRLETKLALTSSYRFFHHVLRLPVEFFTQRFGGEVGSRVAINDRVAGLLSGELAAHLLNALMAVLFLVFMLCYDVLADRAWPCSSPVLECDGGCATSRVAAVMKTCSFASGARPADGARRWPAFREADRNPEGDRGRVRLFQPLGGNPGQGDDGQPRLAEPEPVHLIPARMVPPLLASLGTVAILGLGAQRVMTGSLTIGALVAFQSFMASFLAPVGALLGLGASLQEVEGQVNRLDDVLRTRVAHGQLTHQPEARSEASPRIGIRLDVSKCLGAPAAKLAGQLELRNITFGYSILDSPLIKDFNLNVKPGARVALVGLRAPAARAPSPT